MFAVTDSKCGCPQGHVGSNPTFSAKTRLTGRYIACEFCYLLARLSKYSVKEASKRTAGRIHFSKAPSQRGPFILPLLDLLCYFSGQQTSSIVTNIGLFSLPPEDLLNRRHSPWFSFLRQNLLCITIIQRRLI